MTHSRNVDPREFRPDRRRLRGTEAGPGNPSNDGLLVWGFPIHLPVGRPFIIDPAEERAQSRIAAARYQLRGRRLAADLDRMSWEV